VVATALAAETPQRQKAASFNPDEILSPMKEGSAK
jgi:hypothetical protein